MILKKRVLALLLIAAFCGPASAEISDTVHPFASVTYSHDDNLLRLPDSAAGNDGDTVKEVDYGIVFDRPIAQQELTGHLKLTKATFDHFTELNYDGKDALVALAWRLGTHVDGDVGISYVENLASFNDFHSTERNLRTERREYVDANWTFHPSWRVHAGLSQDKNNYELVEESFNDRTQDTAELGLDYLSSNGNRIGVLLRHLKGRYPVERVFDGVTLDEGYNQDEVKANIDWVLTGNTKLQFLGGWARRTHTFFTERDASGPNGRAVVTWTPAGKIVVTGTVWREFAAVDSTFVSNSLNKGASIAPAWNIDAKWQINGLIQSEHRDFIAVSGLEVPSALADSTRTNSLGTTYQPTQAIQMNLSFSRITRGGNAAIVNGGDFRSNNVALNVSGQF